MFNEELKMTLFFRMKLQVAEMLLTLYSRFLDSDEMLYFGFFLVHMEGGSLRWLRPLLLINSYY